MPCVRPQGYTYGPQLLSVYNKASINQYIFKEQRLSLFKLTDIIQPYFTEVSRVKLRHRFATTHLISHPKWTVLSQLYPSDPVRTDSWAHLDSDVNTKQSSHRLMWRSVKENLKLLVNPSAQHWNDEDSDEITLSFDTQHLVTMETYTAYKCGSLGDEKMCVLVFLITVSQTPWLHNTYHPSLHTDSYFIFWT